MRLNDEEDALRDLIDRYRRGVLQFDDESGREAAAALDAALLAVRGAGRGALAPEDARLAVARARDAIRRGLQH